MSVIETEPLKRAERVLSDTVKMLTVELEKMTIAMHCNLKLPDLIPVVLGFKS